MEKPYKITTHIINDHAGGALLPPAMHFRSFRI